MIEMQYQKEDNKLNYFFNILEDKLEFKHWYFGHFHRNIVFTDNKHTFFYNNIVSLVKN